MSDYHVLTGDKKGESYTIVMHFPVPDLLNAVSVNYRTAIIESGIGGTTALTEGEVDPWDITAAELGLITSGALYEHVESFLADSGAANNAEMNAHAQALYTQKLATEQAKLQRVLKYFGHADDVP